MLAQRALGAAGLRVSAPGLGCVGISELYGPRELDESRAMLRRALELGVDFFDTSDVYGAGHNEQFLGEVLAPARRSIVLATKFGAVRSNDGRSYRVDGRPEYVRQACDASLARLGTDVIDLYYQHRVDPKTPIEESVGAMARLVEAGKVRFLGLSECSATTLRRAHAVHSISAVQSEYSIFTRDVEDAVLPACRDLGVGFVAYSPLGRGLLTRAVGAPISSTARDVRAFQPRFRADNLERNLALVDSLAERAAAHGLSLAQLALAWLLGCGPDVVPIPGTKRRRYLEENVAAAAAETTLTPDEVAAIRAAIPRDAVAGARYAADELARVGL
jgi:aryl-alcohol dehydrogenase-like predicted oxidoreductase